MMPLKHRGTTSVIASRKPNRVPVRQFVQHVQQLNDYLELLPCLYQSNRATKTMKKVEPIDDADLVGHFLCLCPRTWQAQYKLKADMVPQGVCDLQEGFPDTEQEQPGKKGKANPSNSGNLKMVLIHKPIPKKPPTQM